MPDRQRPRASHVLWVSTSLTTRGGIASFVRTLSTTPLWSDWQVRHLATHRDGSIPGRILTFAAALPRLLAELARRPALAHIHTASYGSFYRKSLISLICRLAKVPVVLHVHGASFDRFYDTAPGPVRAWIRTTLGSAAVVLALGSVWEHRLRAIAPQARVRVVPNAVPPMTAAHQPGPTGSPVLVLCLGKLGTRKGTWDLLEAWSQLAPEPGLAHLILAGDGEVERARQTVERLGLSEGVSITGWLSPEEVCDLLMRSQILVLPSHAEGQPMAVLEAMAAGLCVVATTSGGIPELLADTGVLVPPGDLEAITAVLRRVLAEPDLRDDLGRRAAERIRSHFDVSVVSRQLDEIYRSVLS